MRDDDDDKERRRPWWLITGAGVALLVLVGWVGWHWGGPPPPPEDQGRELSQAFLDDIRANRFEAAWHRTSAEFRSAMGWGRFWVYIRSNPAFRAPVEFVNADVAETNGVTLIHCTFQAQPPPSHLRVMLAVEGQDWKVERVNVESSR